MVSLVTSLAATALRPTRLQPKAPVAASETPQSAAPVRAAVKPSSDASELSMVALDGAAHKATPVGAAAYSPDRAVDGAVVEAEPNDTAAAATMTSKRSAVLSGTIDRADDVDYFGFQASAGDRVYAATATFGAEKAASDTVLSVVDANGVTVLERDDDNGSVGSLASSVAGVRVPAAGTYYLAVSHKQAAAEARPYDVYLSLRGGEPAREVEPNNASKSAPSLPASGWVAGRIGTSGDVDMYAVELQAGDVAFLSLDLDPERQGQEWKASLGIGPIAGMYRTATDPGGEGPNSVALMTMAPASGTYYVYVAAAPGSEAVGGYDLNVEVQRGVGQTICGDTGTAPAGQTQAGALQQTGVASTCGTQKVCPTASGPNVKYLAYTYTNNTGSAECVTISVSSTCTGNSRIIAAAYLGSFVPANPCTNYLADAGTSVGSGAPTSFSFTVAAGATYVIVISSARPGNDCGSFCFTRTEQVCTITCPDDITVGTGAGNTQCGANVPFTVTSTCSTDTPTCTANGTPVASGAFFPVGTTAVTCTLAGSQCSFNVTVNDTTPPSVTCPAPTTASAGEGCQAAVPNVLGGVTATDNCTAGGSITLSQSPTAGTLVGPGPTTITVTATDAAGNISTCTTTFTVNDTTAPQVTCPANVTVSAAANACSAVVNFTTPTATDTCGTATVVCAPASGSTFNVGTTTVTCTATDQSNNTASCTFTVTVNDVTPPTLTCPANITQANTPGQCGANVTFTPTVSDNCTGATVSCTPASGTFFAVGTTTVNCTATDTAGNQSTPCSFTVTVNDTQPPTVTCPANITVSAPANACAATVTYTTPTASDNCAGATVACVPASGSSFNVGTTTVTCTATAANGQTGTCTFTVTVNDVTPPTVTCPANMTVNAPANSCSAVVTYTTPTASDNCAGATVACTPASGSSFPKGTTTVTCTATAANGQTGTCTFTVTVRDVTAPTITCPANITASAGAGCTATVNYTTPTATDLCSAPATVACTPASGTAFAIGVTTVTCTATDASNNSASCTFTVTVSDTTAPTITCPAPITVGNAPNQCGANVTFAPTATDNCGGQITLTCTPASGSFFPVGTTTVSCTARDAANNTSAPCTFTVTVNDTQAPVITCPGNITVTANTPNGAVVTYQTPTITDNCPTGGAVTCTPASGTVFPNGTTTVTCTAGKASVICNFTVTVNRPAFNICAVADENNTLDYFVANTTTGYWEYHENGTCRVIYGVAETITRTSFFITLKDEDNPTAKMAASFSVRTGLARVSVLEYATGTTRVITDYNYFNSVCPPAGYHCATKEE